MSLSLLEGDLSFSAVFFFFFFFKLTDENEGSRPARGMDTSYYTLASVLNQKSPKL